MGNTVHTGDTVKWTSQAGGSSLTKCGEVIAILAPNEDAQNYLPANLPVSRFKAQRTSLIERCLVAVPRPGSGLIDYYAPSIGVVTIIARANPDEAEQMDIDKAITQFSEALALYDPQYPGYVERKRVIGWLREYRDLRQAVMDHRRNVWGDGPVEKEADRKLYALLGERGGTP